MQEDKLAVAVASVFQLALAVLQADAREKAAVEGEGMAFRQCLLVLQGVLGSDALRVLDSERPPLNHHSFTRRDVSLKRQGTRQNGAGELTMQDLRALINEILRKNRASREAMLTLISSGEVIAFVGAGLSAPLKYPSWNDLLAKLHGLASRTAPFDPSEGVKADVLQYAEEIKKHLDGRGALREFYNAVGREFMPRNGTNCTACHHRLAKLPFRAFVTTNYDDSLEQALNDCAMKELGRARPDPGLVIKPNKADRHIVSLFLRSIVEPADKHQRHIGHIHGRYNDTANIILAASDYEDAYGFILKGSKPRDVPSSTLHRQLVWSLFATRQLVFFGCSMEDPYIKTLLDMVAADLWEWDQPIHFVVLPIDEDSALSVDTVTLAFGRLGLQAVFFDNCNGTFAGLDQLLDEAIERGQPDESERVASTSLQSEMQTTNSLERSEAKTPASPQDQAAQLKWLEDINEVTAKDLRKNED